jgi:putative Holliday junction resolvase
VKPRTRLLGIDFGTVRVGLAVSDAERRIASPLAQYRRGSRDQDERFFKRIVEQEDVGSCVLGLPIHLSGEEGPKAKQARAFGTWLGQITGLEITYWDERFTSVEAENALLSAGLTNKKRKERRDQVAAQILLQCYLDAGCPPSSFTGPLDNL